MAPGFREFLDAAVAGGLARRVGGTVDSGFEPGCFVKWMYHAQPPAERFGFWFESVEGTPVPLATAILGASRASYALGLGVPEHAINQRWAEALEAPRPVETVGTAPCQEIVRTGADADLGWLPIPVWTPGKDAGPYLTTLTINQGFGAAAIRNCAVYRTQVQDGKHVVINLNRGRQGYELARQWWDQGKPAPIAWVVGAAPVVYQAAVANLPFGLDELTVAGGLAGAPLRVVKACTSDLLVPADAEIVIEGEVLPDRVALEGPFGESAGYMSDAADKPVARITAITHRRNPIYYGLASQMPPSESTTLQSISNAALILWRLRNEWGERKVRDCHIDLMFGGGGAHLIVAMEPGSGSHARDVGCLLAERTPVKRITLVDADIDIRDPQDLDWVMASHFDPVRDITILTGFPMPMDHAVTPGPDGRKLGSKLVVDATRTFEPGPVSLPEAGLMERARQRWEAAGLPPLTVPKRLRNRLERG